MDKQLKLKWIKVEDWYPGLSTYTAHVEHVFWSGTYQIRAVGSAVYEGRNDGYEIRWVPQGRHHSEGRQIGSLKTRLGRGERYLQEAKQAAQQDRDSWKEAK